MKVPFTYVTYLILEINRIEDIFDLTLEIARIDDNFYLILEIARIEGKTTIYRTHGLIRKFGLD